MSNSHRESLSNTRSRFFVTMAGLLLVITFVGFAPSFYLKIFFDTPELPWYVHLHGAVLSGWYMLFLTQTVLITTKRTATHRRLGVLAGVAAVVLVLMIFYAVLDADASTEARGIIRKQPIEFIVLGDLSLMLAIWVHDFLSDKRVHATTVWGSALIFGGLLASAGLAGTESGKAFVTAISLGTG